MKRVFICLILFLHCANSQIVFAQRLNPEKYYQNKWASENNAIQEYILPDKARADCITKDYAIEFDFADKWAEAIGQSLYYGMCLNKKPAIALIMENPQRDEKYLKRIQTIAQQHGITIFTITP